jgi:hypothetical protein
MVRVGLSLVMLRSNSLKKTKMKIGSKSDREPEDLGVIGKGFQTVNHPYRATEALLEL